MYYLLYFYKNKKNKLQALINFGSKIHTMTLAYTSKPGFKVRQTNVRAEKINNSILEIFGIVLLSF